MTLLLHQVATGSCPRRAGVDDERGATEGTEARVDDTSGSSAGQPVGHHRSIDARALWTGGVAAGLVAALVAVAGLVIARGVLNIPVLAPKDKGTWGNANTPTYAVVAFVVALVATGLIHLLLLYTPQPFTFFGWIMAVAIVLAAAEPFTSDARLAAKVATAAINVVIGLAISTLVTGSARRSVVMPPPIVPSR